jgi:hypothetical protein
MGTMLRLKVESWASRATPATPVVESAVRAPGGRLCHRWRHDARSVALCPAVAEPIAYLGVDPVRGVEDSSPGDLLPHFSPGRIARAPRVLQIRDRRWTFVVPGR